VFPENKEQISQILKIANKDNIPVIPRCAGTNHVGGCVAKCGGIIVQFSKMNKVIEINKENLTCTVEPGVVVEKLQQAVQKEGLFYPPDPSNLKVSTIGGSIALSSGGPRGFKYGGTKDYILGLEVVLADGSIIQTGGKVAKNVTGYNLTQLFVGSEGTLGIITKAYLKLVPKPQTQKVMLVYFNDINNTANAVTEIISAKIMPSTLDIMDKITLQTIEKFYPTGLLTDMEAALVIEVDGFLEIIEKQIKQISKICQKYNYSDIKIAQNDKETADIWFARRSAFGAITRLNPNVITEDIVVPRNYIPEIIKFIQNLAVKYNLTICTLGHIGDGNIHPNFSLDLRNNEQKGNYQKAVKELFKKVIELGGTLTGEHGIGLVKKDYLSMELDDVSINLMAQIKKSFDPKGILNPEKVL
ncbi:MAG: FAD-linked oxidase C-terminal domain-containing protein, partial [Candidatus Gastranaerophilales bacterium]|nr:FAD-linked oxidase C-terminal domain-containing protein [Candidatus Gastranaerophilales bacterium]